MPAVPKPTDPAPGDWPYGLALWLLARNPRLERWVQRIPGAWVELMPNDRSGAIHPYNSNALLEALQAFDANTEPHEGADAYGVLSGGERGALRILAFFAGPVKLDISDLDGFDDEGEKLVRDWTAAVLARHGIAAA